MAVRRPVYIGRDIVFNQSEDIFEYTDAFMTDMQTFAGWVHSQYPSTELVTTGTTGTLLANQNFTDTYYVAGAYTTRVDRFSTEAETPNISMVTDTYSRIRQINNVGTEPTGDANNLQFPLYLTDTGDLRAMNRQDFVDTFVTPVIPLIASNGTDLVNGGTYFMTTSAAPTNGTVLPTPAAVNSVANVGAYTSAGIPEATKQTDDTNYYIARVEYPLTAYDPIELVLPLYFDAGSEQLRMYTATEWAALLGPFLQYYMGSNPDYSLSYNINGDGVARGTSFVDSRVTPTGTGYTQLFVNANDYRTQEFPTGTESVVAGTTKTLRLVIGTSGATYAASSNPVGSVDEGSTLTFTMTTTGVSNGSTIPYSIGGITEADITSGALTGYITINSNTGSTSITLNSDGVIESETVNFLCMGQTVDVTVNDTGLQPFPASTLVGWSNETRELYNATSGDLAQAFCTIEFDNEFTSNNRVRITTTSGTNAATATPKTGYMEIGANYTTPLIQFRYTQTGSAGTGTNFDDGTYQPSTWYTLTDGGVSNQLNAIAEATCPPTGQSSQSASASGLVFEVRISEAGQPTVTRSSGTDSYNLNALASTLAIP